jgi:arylformamidase
MAGPDLDDDYVIARLIPDAAAYVPRWNAAAAGFRADLGARAELGIPYGPHEREAFDLFHPVGKARGLVVFVHGGYWLRNHRSMWSHLAAGPLAEGWAVAMPSYVLAPEVRISRITRQIATAIDAAAARIDGPIRLSGHSAGGHLVSRMLCADIAAGRAFDGRIVRVVSISGLHDLRPLMRTSMNADLGLDLVEATAESAALHGDVRQVPVTAWVGGAESRAFHDQAALLAANWPFATAHVDPGHSHFSVIDALTDARSDLTRALLA